MRQLFFICLTTLSLTVSAKTITCPTAREANKLFAHCKINVGKQSCGKRFRGTSLVLNSTTEGVYGGKHQFDGFRDFTSMAISDGYFYCKYNFIKKTCKEAWVIGSRYRLAKKCRLQPSKRYGKMIYCKAKNPKRCQIVC